MYLAYCLNPANGSWTPAVHLDTAEAAFRYCLLHYRWTEEIRVCDEEDFIVLHLENGVLKCPMPDGSLKTFTLPRAF